MVRLALLLLRRRAAAASMNSTPRRWRMAGVTMARPVCARTYGPNYYAAFAIDPDGYRLEAYCGRDRG